MRNRHGGPQGGGRQVFRPRPELPFPASRRRHFGGGFVRHRKASSDVQVRHVSGRARQQFRHGRQMRELPPLLRGVRAVRPRRVLRDGPRGNGGVFGFQPPPRPQDFRGGAMLRILYPAVGEVEDKAAQFPEMGRRAQEVPEGKLQADAPAARPRPGNSDVRGAHSAAQDAQRRFRNPHALFAGRQASAHRRPGENNDRRRGIGAAGGGRQNRVEGGRQAESLVLQCRRPAPGGLVQNGGQPEIFRSRPRLQGLGDGKRVHRRRRRARQQRRV